jgi:replicative DNA helicase
VPGPATARRESGTVEDIRTPPHSVEAEQALLGGLLMDSVAWENVADVVRAGDFYRPDHQLIFEAIGALAGNGRPCDAVTVSEQLQRTGLLEEAGGLAYLGSLVRDTPTAANVRAYAAIVRERALLRRLIRAGTDIAASAFSEEGLSAGDLVDRAEQRVFEIAEEGQRSGEGAQSAKDLLPALVDKIDSWHSNPD